MAAKCPSVELRPVSPVFPRDVVYKYPSVEIHLVYLAFSKQLASKRPGVALSRVYKVFVAANVFEASECRAVSSLSSFFQASGFEVS